MSHFLSCLPTADCSLLGAGERSSRQQHCSDFKTNNNSFYCWPWLCVLSHRSGWCLTQTICLGSPVRSTCRNQIARSHLTLHRFSLPLSLSTCSATWTLPSSWILKDSCVKRPYRMTTRCAKFDRGDLGAPPHPSPLHLSSTTLEHQRETATLPWQQRDSLSGVKQGPKSKEGRRGQRPGRGGPLSLRWMMKAGSYWCWLLNSSECNTDNNKKKRSQEYFLVSMNVIDYWCTVRVVWDGVKWCTCVFCSVFTSHNNLDLTEGECGIFPKHTKLIYWNYCIAHILLWIDNQF